MYVAFLIYCSFFVLLLAIELEDEMESTNRINYRRLAPRKGEVWKNELLSESFGSRWTNKVIDAYYKIMIVFLTLHASQPFVGALKPNNPLKGQL